MLAVKYFWFGGGVTVAAEWFDTDDSVHYVEVHSDMRGWPATDSITASSMNNWGTEEVINA